VKTMIHQRDVLLEPSIIAVVVLQQQQSPRAQVMYVTLIAFDLSGAALVLAAACLWLKSL
jgi:hypothetical protein